MKLLAIHSFWFRISAAVFVLHLIVAAFARASFGLTIFGDTLSCLFLITAFFAVRRNFSCSSGLLHLFWKLTASGLFLMFLSEVYWFRYDSLLRYSSPSPVLGDSLFLLAHIFFLFALALRPHSSSTARDLGLRWLDFALLAFWWFSLYAYFCLPWQSVVRDLSKYNPSYYLLVFIQHSVLIVALTVLSWRNRGPWRGFYAHLLFVFCFIAAGNLLISGAIDHGSYYAGGFYDTPFFLALFWLSFAASLGSSLQPQEDDSPHRELKQSVWTARIAMLAILSLPMIALVGYFVSPVPAVVAVFRLRLVFAAMLVLGALLFWKLTLLSHQLVKLVLLTRASIENLKSVQKRVAHGEKLTALGRLAAGAAHEISNPLTAILGYSELLADTPSLLPQDRERIRVIQQEVRRAQSAVDSLRTTLRNNRPPHPTSVNKDFSS